MGSFEIREITRRDQAIIGRLLTESWGSAMSVSRGRMFNVLGLPGFICLDGDQIKGLITYNIEDSDCEIVTLNSWLERKGLAEQLIGKVINIARQRQCRRVWLITTNDNVHAIRFYQKRGFEWVAFYKDAMMESRKLKPEIPTHGNDGIPIMHEIEFEFRL